MKPSHSRLGFSEMERKHEYQRRYPSYRQHSRNHYSYNGNSKSYHNKYSGSCVWDGVKSQSHMNFDRVRDRNVRYNGPGKPHFMDYDEQIPQSSKEAGPWSEEALELQRQQQVSNTANELLNKLRVWNTERNDGKEHGGNYSERAIMETSREASNKAEKFTMPPGRSQSSGTGNIHKKTSKMGKATHENARKKATSSEKLLLKNKFEALFKNKQKIIHQNIIGELMTMPKENLSKVLMNPKIHPKFERKMAQIVKENRLLLAQKFRNLAESKINSGGQFQFQSNFVNDVENLIDPDLAVDLCQLPPELIKQMGDIFQLDFDNHLENSEPQEVNDGNYTCEENTYKEMDYSDFCSSSSISRPKTSVGSDFERLNVNVEDWQTTRGNAKNIEPNVGKITVRDFANNCSNSPTKVCHPSVADSSVSNNYSANNSGSEFCSFEPAIQQKEATVQHHSNESQMFQENTELQANQREVGKRTDFSDKEKCLGKKSCAVQTKIHLIEMDYTETFGKNVNEDTERTILMKELNMIESLIHTLNQRKLFLFVRLMSLKNCKTTNGLHKKVMQIITSGDKLVARKMRKMTYLKLSRDELLSGPKQPEVGKKKKKIIRPGRNIPEARNQWGN